MISLKIRKASLKGLTALFLFALSFCTAGCSSTPEPVSREIFAMDTYMTLTAYGDNAKKALDEAENEIHRLDDLLSTGNVSSEISLLNSSGSGELSPDVLSLTERSLEIYNQTNGAFDICIYPLMQLWGFDKDVQSVPDEKSISETLLLCGSEKLHLNGNRLTLSDGSAIDLGAIAKGYTADRVIDIFQKNGITSGVISLGGNVRCCGTKPDGSLWKCGITDPASPGDNSSLLGTVLVSDKSVVTSGGYERFFEQDGKKYHHIMDPHTGYPAQSGLLSVTVISEDGTLADGLSTACFVMGLQRASDFWRKGDGRFELVMQTDSGELYITEGLDGSFTSSYPFNIIKASE